MKEIYKDKKNYTSKYVGVSFYKNTGKWVAKIIFKGKTIFLGTFENELQASKCYQNALKNIKQNKPIQRQIKKKTSKYKGVCYLTREQKWTSYITINNKRKQLGYFNTELEAYEIRTKALKEFI